jgi:TnpA family transposase
MFSLSEDQNKQASEWLTAHRKECRIKYGGAIGGTITWEFTPTSIGLIVVIVCACGAKCDISNYDDW